jgi:hypothetical protein
MPKRVSIAPLSSGAPVVLLVAESFVVFCHLVFVRPENKHSFAID